MSHLFDGADGRAALAGAAGERQHGEDKSDGCACPVCAALSEPFLSVDARDYFRCGRCQARFLHPAQRPAHDAELAQYRLHENSVDDPGYRHFLSKLAGPLIERLAPASIGLDYGCGPGPALAAMLEEAGHEVALYDPFFVPGPSVLDTQYDFITCTEVAEHFHHPAGEFEHLRQRVRPGGWLAIMTCFQTEDDRFADWHYRKDPTHVVFYRESTFHYLAGEWGWTCQVPAKDVVLMQRPMTGDGK